MYFVKLRLLFVPRKCKGCKSLVSDKIPSASEDSSEPDLVKVMLSGGKYRL